MFGRNVCGRERDIRFLIGILAVIAAIFYGNWIAGIIGVYVLLTAVYSYCLVNKLLGRNSCSLLDRKPLS
jgi:type IV secretory pathway TrbD component